MTHPAGTDKGGRLWLIIFAMAAVLYIATCARGPVWQDSGMIQYRVAHGDVEGKLGLALAHPLFYLLTMAGVKVLPGELAFRVNLMSALFGALAVANMFLLVYLWLRELWPAVVAAGSLALSHTFWQHAALPETYDLYIAVLLGELMALLCYSRSQNVRWLYLLALLNGLAVANHMLGSIPAACYVVLIICLLAKRQLRPRHLMVMAAIWIIGALPYEILVIGAMIRQGDVMGPLASALFGEGYRGDVMNATLSLRIIKEDVLFLVMNFPTYNLLLAIPGVAILRQLVPRRWFMWVLLAITGVFFLFAFRYTVPDRYAFFIPFYTMLALLMGLGAHAILRRYPAVMVKPVLVGGLLIPVVAYLAMPGAAKAAGVGLGTGRELPFRDDYQYFLQPWKMNDDSAERFAQSALEQVELDALIYADSTSVYPLLMVQEQEGLRPDVRIVSGNVRTPGAPDLTVETVNNALAEGTAVYVVTPGGYCPGFMAEGYAFEPEGVLHRVRGQ